MKERENKKHVKEWSSRVVSKCCFFFFRKIRIGVGIWTVLRIEKMPFRSGLSLSLSRAKVAASFDHVVRRERSANDSDDDAKNER